jgi:hypothetical protein
LANITDRLSIQNNPTNDGIEANELNELSEHFVSNPIDPMKISFFQKIEQEPDFDRPVG